MQDQHELESQSVVELQPPRRFVVILHNDNYSTWEFVIEVLRRVFHKNENEAVAITHKVHHEGSGRCGVYSHEVAEMKVSQVHAMAKASGFPLKCTLEEA
jgi:ATP-dependent Clp protease adaptor protein ClpS